MVTACAKCRQFSRSGAHYWQHICVRVDQLSGMNGFPCSLTDGLGKITLAIKCRITDLQEVDVRFLHLTDLRFASKTLTNQLITSISDY